MTISLVVHLYEFLACLALIFVAFVCGLCVVEETVKKVREYLNMVVDEVRWSDCLNPYNHSPHFPYLVTHFTDSMPISSIGGALSDVLFIRSVPAIYGSG